MPDQYVITNEDDVYYYGEGVPVLPTEEPHTYVSWDNILSQMLEMIIYSRHTLKTIGIYKLVPLTPLEVAKKVRKTMEHMGIDELDKLLEDVGIVDRSLQEITDELDKYLPRSNDEF